MSTQYQEQDASPRVKVPEGIECEKADEFQDRQVGPDTPIIIKGGGSITIESYGKLEERPLGNGVYLYTYDSGSGKDVPTVDVVAGAKQFTIYSLTKPKVVIHYQR